MPPNVGVVMRNIVMRSQNGELLAELNRHAARFLVVGGVGVHFYAPERAYGDLDILIDPSPLNAGRLLLALQHLRIEPGFNVGVLAQPKIHLPIKILEFDVDVITPATDVDFASEWERATDAHIEYQPVRIAARDLLIRMKSGTDRHTDAADIEILRRAMPVE